MSGVNTYFTIKTLAEYIIPAIIVVVIAIFVIVLMICNKIAISISNKKEAILLKEGYILSTITYCDGNINIGHLTCYANYIEDTDVLYYIKKSSVGESKIGELKDILKQEKCNKITAFKTSGGSIRTIPSLKDL